MLPLLQYREKIVASLKANKKLIITAPPGTGKSTQVPQFFAEQCSPGKKLIMLEPRRIAARSLAYRVAEEMHCACGSEVGYQVRFERKSSEKTKILFLTYGTFIQLLQSDPLIARSSIIAFDEFHERSLEADTALAWVCFLAQTKRPDLEIMVLSATLELEPLQAYLENCGVIDVQEKAHPVELLYQPPASPQEFLSKQVERALGGLLRQGDGGSVLVFLPGVFEIERASEVLYDACKRKGYRLLTLHGRMPLAEQQRVLRLPGQEPCMILSTNVAETSLTVPGVTAVIDSGLARVASYDPERERNTLYLQRISMQNAKQRAGRAGRLGPGVCVRLWGREDERSMPETIVPEILRLDLAKTMLSLCAFSEKISGSEGLGFLLPPPAEQCAKAREELLRYGAIEPNSSKEITDSYAIVPAGITALGKAMCRLPVEPSVAAVLLQSRSRDEQTINAAMAALGESNAGKMIESQDLFQSASAFISDRKRTEWGKEAVENFEQLERLLKEEKGAAAGNLPGLPVKEELQKRVSMVWMRTFSHRIAVRAGETSLYEFQDRRSAKLTIKSVQGGKQVLPPVILALAVHEQAGRQQAKKTSIPLFIPIEQVWIQEAFPKEIRKEAACRWDETKQRVVVEEQTAFRGIALERREVQDKAAYKQKIAACLAEQLIKGAWEWEKDDPKAAQYACRVKQVAAAYPEMKIPCLDNSDWGLVWHDLAEGKTSLEEVKNSSMIKAVKVYIGESAAGFVEKKAPDIVILPSGKKGRIAYSENAPPELSARITDLVGYRDRFTLMDGRVQGVFDILAPNYRTVQKTADLGSFWKNVYPSIKNGLKRKYPRHPWP